MRNIENHKTDRGTLGLIAHIRSQWNRFASGDAANWFGRDLAEYYGVRCVPRLSGPKAAQHNQALNVVAGTHGAASAA